MSGRTAAVAGLVGWALLAGVWTSVWSAEDERPNYDELRLEAIFPAGGRQGSTVEVELRTLSAGVFEARRVLVDGPPGITVTAVRQEPRAIFATLEIAPDAVPGKRGLRVLGERVGLTNMMYFTVGTLPEVREAADATEQEITLPCVVNGRIDPAADIDTYGFQASAGQRLQFLASAQALDSHGQYKDYGFVDLNLQILDARGQVIAAASDSLGLDPLIEWLVPATGKYAVRVEHVLYRGFPQAVYRLILGDLPLATAVFPPGARRGETVTAQLTGPGIPAEGEAVTLHAAPGLPWRQVGHPATAGNAEVPWVVGEFPEHVESEPNEEREQATPLPLDSTVNARFARSGDVDWYRLSVPSAMTVELSTLAQRFLRSPVDTVLEVYDSTGKKLAANDDGFPIEYMWVHDFQSPDSRLTWAVPAAGDYWIKVADQAASEGPRAVYRLTAQRAVPDFDLQLFPDAVPIWGPGSTAGFCVKVNRQQGFEGDIELRIEGLPAGWTGSRAVNIVQTPARPANSYYAHFGLRHLLTITAPTDAPVLTLTEFRVVGRALRDGVPLERTAQPLTLYYSSDIGFFRLTSTSRAVVARARRPWLTTEVQKVSGRVGSKLEIPVQVHQGDDLTTLVLVPNLATAGVACAYNAPSQVTLRDRQAVVPITITPETPLGTYYLTISRLWGSDIRVGMPGPCTPLIELTVLPPP